MQSLMIVLMKIKHIVFEGRTYYRVKDYHVFVSVMN